MGVPKFFRWISERYPKINQPLNCDPSVETYSKYFEHDGTPKTIDFSTNNSKKAIKKDKDDNIEEEIIDPNVPEFDNLYIDMNGVIHGCSHANNSQKSDSDDDTEEEEDDAITEEEIFANICYYLDRVVSDIVKPKKVLYLAIDGVAPRAKLNQQRARRFKAGKEAEVAREQAKQEEMDRKEQQYDLSDDSSGSSDDEEEEEDGVLILSSDSTTKKKRGEEGDTAEQDSEFHHNSITPGTPFLQKCSEHIQNFVRYKLQEDDPDGVSKWKHLKIYFSGPNVPGEGEHKIMHYIRRQKRLKQQELEKQEKQQGEGGGVSLLDLLDVPPQSPTRHCLMGQDGDLIMLGLATHEPNFCLLRERVTFGRQNKAPSTQMRNPSGFNHTQNKPKIPILEYIHNTNFELLQLNVLRDYLALEFNASTTPTAQHHDDETSRKYAEGEYVERPTYDLERTIDDFVFMTFFIGNDFLPHLPALDIADGAFDVLFMTYKKHRDRWWFGSMKRKANSSSTLEKSSTMNANDLYFTDNGSIVSGRRLENFLVDIGRHEDPYYEWKKKIEMKVYAQARDSDIKHGRTPSIPSEQELEDLELKKRLEYKEMMEKIALEAIGDTKNQRLFDYNDESDDGEEEEDEGEEDSLLEEDTNQAHANGRRNRRRRGGRASSTSSRRRNRRPVLTSKTSFTIKSSNSTDSTQMGASSTQDEEEEKGMFSKLKKLLNESLSLTTPSSSSSTNNTSHSTKHLELDEAHMDDLKGRYYYDKFQFTPLDLDKHYRLRKKYIEGLVWCLKYYYHGCISWSWYYPYHYGPMKSDLRNLKPILKSITFGYGGPFLPFTQLLACMPPTNAHLLPKPFQFLMLPPSSDDDSDNDDNGAEKKVSPILEYYPTDFEIDMNGKRNPWEMVVKLPFIDSKRLNNAVSEHVDFNLLTPDEKKRNSIEDTLVYYYNNDTVGGKEEQGMVEKIVSEENLYNRKPNRSKLQQQQELPLRSNTNQNYGDNDDDSDDSSLTLPSSLFLKNAQMIQPGFSTLNSVPISQLDREKIALNIFGTRSRYNTCVLKMEDFMYSILPSAKVLASKFVGTQVFYNYPHFSEAFVTAVSDSHGIQRGSNNEYRKWNTSESDLWKQNSMRLYKQYLFGENKVGSGGWHLPTETANSPDHAASAASGGGGAVLGEASTINKNNNDNNTNNSHTKNSYTMKKSSYYRRNPGITEDTKNIILTVRPLKGLVEGKYKIYHRDEINIPFFAALWTPEKMDPRFLGVQARLEKNPFRLVQPEEPCLTNHVPVSKKKRKSKVSSNATTRGNRKNNKWSAEEKQQNNKRKKNKKENIHLKGISLKHLNLDSQKTPLSNTSNSSSFLPPLGKDMRGRQFSSIACYNTSSSFLLKQSKQNDGMRIMPKSNFSTTTPSSSLIMMKKGNLCTRYYSKNNSTVIKRSTIGFAAATTALLMFSNVLHTAQGSHYPRHHTLATTALETSSVSFKNGKSSLFSNIFEVSRGGSGDFSYNNNEEEHDNDDDMGIPSSSRVPPLEFFHGTTTLSFLFQGGIICAVDSRASMGNFVGSKTTQKVLPISKYILGTMAGGAADCSFWIRKLQSYANMYSLDSSSARMSVAKASRMLSNYMYQATQNKMDLSVGTMIMGFDSSSQQEGEIYYIDQTGMRLNGDLFAVGSGSTFALGILDSLYTREERYSLSEHEAIELGIKAIRYATFRDAFSGGYIGVYLITKKDGWKKVFSEDLAATNTLSSLSSSSSSLNNTETNSK